MECIKITHNSICMEINEIKQQLSIVRVLEHYGLKPDKNGMLKCPFHDDKTPSMLIYPKSNTYCCFSSNCTAGTGDQIQFIELMQKQVGAFSGNPASNGSKHQALILAKELLGVPVEISTVSTEINIEDPTVEILDYDKIFSKLKQNIGKSPRAKQYIQERNLQADKLEIGYTSTGLSVNNGNGFLQLKDCIVFPLKDKHNKVVSLYGRGLVKDITIRQTEQDFIPLIQVPTQDL